MTQSLLWRSEGCQKEINKGEGSKDAKIEVSPQINNSPRTGKLVRQWDLHHSLRKRSHEYSTDSLACSEFRGPRISEWDLWEKGKEGGAGRRETERMESSRKGTG